MAVRAFVVSPAGAIGAGWDHYSWNGYVKSAGTVAFDICNGTAANQVAAVAQNFNLRIID